jgi:hypothetical protein
VKGREPIPVKKLVFEHRRPVNVPGNQAAYELPGDAPGNRSHWNIEYRPWMRHFYIEYFRPSASEPYETCFLHESQVVRWEPLVL